MVRLLIAFLLLSAAQQAAAQAPAIYNQTDAGGRQTGQWIIRQDARMGEEAYSEWGSFDHGLRYGTWYKFDGDGEITAIEHYRFGVLDGEAKYFERGHLTTIGHYRGLNPRYAYDTIFVTDPGSGAELRRVIPTDRGTVKQGLWRFYDAGTGRLERELDYQVDEVIAQQEFSIAATDSAWYKRREQAMPHRQKHLYKPPRDKQYRYTDFR